MHPTEQDEKNGMRNSRSGILRWIAVFKLAKASLMVVVGFGILRLVGHNQESTLDSFVSKLGIDPDRGFVDMAIGKLVNLSPDKLRAFGFASFVYAALFFTEGVGLWLQKRWAEWFTAIITLSLVPLELYEIHRHATIGKVLVLLVNVAVVVYLVVRIRKEQSCRP